jgi:hypothetical protein
MTIRETVRTTGWEFAGTMYRALFEELRPAERLNLRRVLAAQVALAKSTPTKGDNDGI